MTLPESLHSTARRPDSRVVATSRANSSPRATRPTCTTPTGTGSSAPTSTAPPSTPAGRRSTSNPTGECPRPGTNPSPGRWSQSAEQVDRFDAIFNTERPHQALPGRITPQNAWNATPKTDPPRPVTPQTPPPAPSEEIRVKLVGNTGAVEFRGIRFGIGRAFAEHRVCVMDAGNTVMVFDLHGTLIIEHPWPKPGTKYVSSGRPRGRARKTPSTE